MSEFTDIVSELIVDRPCVNCNGKPEWRVWYMCSDCLGFKPYYLCDDDRKIFCPPGGFFKAAAHIEGCEAEITVAVEEPI
jgi:hypothetical protein